MAVRLTMGLGAAGKAMPFHDTGKATSLGFARDIDLVANSKLLDGQGLANFVISHVIRPVLSQMAYRLLTLVGFTLGMFLVSFQKAQVTLLAFGQAMLFGLAKTNLDGFITVVIICLDLGDVAGTSLNDGNRGHNPILVKDLRHTYFRA